MKKGRIIFLFSIRYLCSAIISGLKGEYFRKEGLDMGYDS